MTDIPGKGFPSRTFFGRTCLSIEGIPASRASGDGTPGSRKSVSQASCRTQSVGDRWRPIRAGRLGPDNDRARDQDTGKVGFGPARIPRFSRAPAVPARCSRAWSRPFPRQSRASRPGIGRSRAPRSSLAYDPWSRALWSRPISPSPARSRANRGPAHLVPRVPIEVPARTDSP
jgi:hypothetical protein